MKYVIITNQNRFVGIPYIVGGFKSFLYDETKVKDIAKFKTKEEAEERLEEYLNPYTQYYISKYNDGEKLYKVIPLEG